MFSSSQDETLHNSICAYFCSRRALRSNLISHKISSDSLH